MRTRRRFTADFKAKVALESLRGDKAIQEIAARHKVHPNQVSAWKRQAMDGLGALSRVRIRISCFAAPEHCPLNASANPESPAGQQYSNQECGRVR